MRRLTRVLLLGLGPILSACSSFGSTPDGPDGGSTGTDGGSTFCTRNSAALFCDDFEGAGRVVSAPAPWDSFGGSKTDGLSIGAGFESTAGLRAVGRFAPGDFRSLLWKVPTERVTQGLRWSFRLRATKLTEYAAGTQAQVGIAGFSFDDGKALTYVLSNGMNGVLTGFASTNVVPDTNYRAFTEPPNGLSRDAWMDIRIEVQPQPSGNVFRFFVGPMMLSELTLPPAPSPALALGAQGYAGGADTELAFDDVLVTPL